MKYGDKYMHFKGGEYFFQGIALPLREGNLSLKTVRRLMNYGTVRYHENTHDIELYAIDGAMFIDSDKPHVIYQSEKDYNTDKCWAREVDDFFDTKFTDDGIVKKFRLIN
jgi:hypothetical protein